MERLTKRIRENVYYTKGKYEETLAAECTGSDVRTILNRLADYEDTGFDLQEIQKSADAICAYGKIFQGLPLTRIHELAQADREGKCVVLPCRVGDKVYCIQSYFNDAKMRSEKKVKCRVVDFMQSLPDLLECEGMIYKFSDIGKIVFLTREEAESALEKMKEGK